MVYHFISFQIDDCEFSFSGLKTLARRTIDIMKAESFFFLDAKEQVTWNLLEDIDLKGPRHRFMTWGAGVPFLGIFRKLWKFKRAR